MPEILELHWPYKIINVINDWRDMMRMIKGVDSPNLKACLDAPIMDDKSPENIQKAAQAVGDLQMLTHFGGEFGRNTEGKIVLHWHVK